MSDRGDRLAELQVEQGNVVIQNGILWLPVEQTSITHNFFRRGFRSKSTSKNGPGGIIVGEDLYPQITHFVAGRGAPPNSSRRVIGIPRIVFRIVVRVLHGEGGAPG